MPTVIEWIKKAATRRTLDNRPSTGTTDTKPAAASDVPARYTNLGEVARGGMGAIVKVYDKEIRRELVMKVLDPSDNKIDATRIGLFIEEAQITGQLDHPNICPVHDVGADESGARFFTMKIVRGKTLAEIVHAPEYEPSDARCLREALEVVLRVCDALAFAHAKGVVHRDLKPENIMVGDFGQVYLMDFGVAKLMRNAAEGQVPVSVARNGPSPIDEGGAIVGTLMYMAPEQARGDAAAVDQRSDVFGVGAILYEVLTQIPPYYANDLGQLVLQAQSASWRAPQELVGDDMHLPAALCAICEKALAPDPAERFGNIGELKAALEQFLAGGLSFPTQTVAAGECVVTEGEPGDTAYIVQRGYCRVYKLINGQQTALADLSPGDVFGETSVFANVPRTATVQALSDVVVQVVRKEVFEKDLGLASSVGTFVNALAARFVSTDRELKALRDKAAADAALAALAAATPGSSEAPPPPSPDSGLPAPSELPPLPPVVDVAPPVAPAPPPLGLNPLTLVDAAVRLQALSDAHTSPADLLLEAIALGVDELARRRRRPHSPAARETPIA